jgi:hypothetical protein
MSLNHRLIKDCQMISDAVDYFTGMKDMILTGMMRTGNEYYSNSNVMTEE